MSETCQDRRFPVQGGPSIPWRVIALHEAQVLKNHSQQTLERLSQRGGLAPWEVVAAMEGRSVFEYMKQEDFEELALQKLEAINEKEDRLQSRIRRALEIHKAGSLNATGETEWMAVADKMAETLKEG